MPIPPRLETLARQLELEGRRLEARALRFVARLYRALSFADLLALTAKVVESPNPIYRASQLDRLMASFRASVSSVRAPPAEVVPLLGTAVRAGISTTEAMVNGGRGLLEASFSVPPTRELEYVNHAADRLTRFWGVEQERLAQQSQAVLIEGLERGMGVRQISANLRERVEVSRGRTQLIVSNELGNASAFAMQQSQQEAGATQYIWRSASDARVRPAHRTRNGQTFAWDSPPSDGHPGQPIRCRCVAMYVPPEE